jgi:hypothetical protein
MLLLRKQAFWDFHAQILPVNLYSRFIWNTYHDTRHSLQNVCLRAITATVPAAHVGLGHAFPRTVAAGTTSPAKETTCGTSKPKMWRMSSHPLHSAPSKPTSAKICEQCGISNSSNTCCHACYLSCECIIAHTVHPPTPARLPSTQRIRHPTISLQKTDAKLRPCISQAFFSTL